MKAEQSQLNLCNPENFLFWDSTYGVPSNSGVNKALRLILQEQEITPLNMSATGIRHTYASIMLALGIDIWVIAKNMGHKDISQITKTYGHLIKEKAHSENERIRSMLGDLSRTT